MVLRPLLRPDIGKEHRGSLGPPLLVAWRWYNKLRTTSHVARPPCRSLMLNMTEAHLQISQSLALVLPLELF